MRIQKMIHLSALVFFLPLGVLANEFGDMPEVKKIAQGQPKDVVALIERIATCNHWSSEEPYDKARAQEIAKAAKKASCARIDSDAQRLKKKYKTNKKVAEAIRQTKSLIL
jgi:hypothetical protein